MMETDVERDVVEMGRGEGAIGFSIHLKLVIKFK
jgi:hypothetical protein